MLLQLNCCKLTCTKCDDNIRIDLVCQRDSELSFPVNCGKDLFGLAEVLLASEDGICSMEIVRHLFHGNSPFVTTFKRTMSREFQSDMRLCRMI